MGRHLRRRDHRIANGQLASTVTILRGKIFQRFRNSIAQASSAHRPQSGSGISILPARSVSSEVNQRRLLSIPLDAPELVRPTAIIHRKKKKLSRAGLEFLQLIRGEVPVAAVVA